MSNERYLIINADDFGISEGTNEAIETLFREEKITSAGILAPAPFAKEACQISLRHHIPSGVHWTLHSDWAGEDAWRSCAEKEAVPSLLEKERLSADLSKVRQAKSPEVTRELEAQIAFLNECGIRPDHADSHGGTLYGTNGRLFFLNAFRLCRKYELPFRFARSSRFLSRQFEKEPGLMLKTAQRAIHLCARVKRVSLLDDFYSEPHPVRHVDGYDTLKKYYETQLLTVDGNIAEVFLHPSLPEDAFLNRTTEWQKRVWEYEYLKSGDLCKAAMEQGFTLVSWGEAFHKENEE